MAGVTGVRLEWLSYALLCLRGAELSFATSAVLGVALSPHQDSANVLKRTIHRRPAGSPASLRAFQQHPLNFLTVRVGLPHNGVRQLPDFNPFPVCLRFL